VRFQLVLEDGNKEIVVADDGQLSGKLELPSWSTWVAMLEVEKLAATQS